MFAYRFLQIFKMYSRSPSNPISFLISKIANALFADHIADCAPLTAEQVGLRAKKIGPIPRAEWHPKSKRLHWHHKNKPTWPLMKNWFYQVLPGFTRI